MIKIKPLLIMFSSLYLIFIVFTFGIRDSFDTTRPWLNPVLTREEINAAKWMKKNIPENAIVNGGIFIGETFMAISNVKTTVGGDWFLINDSAEWMSDCERIYTTTSPEEAYNIAKKRGISYIFVPPRGRKIHCGYGWKDVVRGKFKDKNYFYPVYNYSNVVIYRVKGVKEENWPLKT